MENPEDVLQALDEFQKMRPTEIPRELEDYLCWVAKTGDPVYQWPLIKALFREKLARVMTDFYETCPNIDGLASCPNVEHFNYDNMKSSLLERLENFANVPFTVQRICELLTSPRKEYNRIDKFMRAIEKNILVVSTRDPVLPSRRSENGDGMVNGSLDDEEMPQVNPPTEEMEVESWVKDCTPTTALPLHGTSENDLPTLSTTMAQNTSVVKQLSSINGSSQEQKISPVSDVENLSSAFVPSNSEFTESTHSDASTAQQEILVNISQITSVVHETSTIVGEVPEAIMNEDTSSQPSLDLESDDNEVSDPSRKLQTTFQAKDFITNSFKKDDDEDEDEEKKPQVQEEEQLSPIEKVEESSSVNENHQQLETSENIVEQIEQSSKPEERLVDENVEEKEVKDEEKSEEQTTEITRTVITENTEVVNNLPEKTIIEEITETKEDDEEAEEETDEKKVDAEEEEDDDDEDEEKTDAVKEEKPTDDQVEDEKVVENLECAETLSESQPEYEVAETSDSDASAYPNEQLTIVETTEDNPQANSLVPEPIPIIEEPKDSDDEKDEEKVEKSEEEQGTVVEEVEEKKIEVIAVPSKSQSDQDSEQDSEDQPPKKVLLVEKTEAVEEVKVEDQKNQEAMEVDYQVTSNQVEPIAEPMEQESNDSVS